MVELFAHGPESGPPPLTPAGLFTQAEPVSWLALVLLLVAAAYLYGVWTLRRRGDRWPVARTLAFLLPGLGGIAAVTLGGLAAYDTTLLSAHMAQHMVLSMVSPIFLALGAPVTLALRTLPRRHVAGRSDTRSRAGWRWPGPGHGGGARRALVAVLHSRPVTVLTFPLVAFAIFVVSPFALYFSGLYRLSLENGLVHELLHVHFILAGCLFFWPLVGVDPLPGRWPHPGRLLLMVLMVPFHTVLGLTIMQSSTLLAGDWYPSLGLDWTDPAADQRLAGGLLWAGGELVSVAVLAVLVVQWIQASEREARRVDRELDRVEAAARAERERAADRDGTAEPLERADRMRP